jgi:hypothetical protein
MLEQGHFQKFVLHCVPPESTDALKDLFSCENPEQNLMHEDSDVNRDDLSEDSASSQYIKKRVIDEVVLERGKTNAGHL